MSKWYKTSDCNNGFQDENTTRGRLSLRENDRFDLVVGPVKSGKDKDGKDRPPAGQVVISSRLMERMGWVEGDYVVVQKKQLEDSLLVKLKRSAVGEENARKLSKHAGGTTRSQQSSRPAQCSVKSEKFAWAAKNKVNIMIDDVYIAGGEFVFMLKDAA